MGFELTKEDELLRMSAIIVAESGVGKTSQCRFLPADQTAFISLESGDLCLKKWGYKPRLRSVIKTTDDLMETFIQLNDGIDGIRYVFIDSLTELGELVLTELKADPKYSDPKMILKMYGTYNDMMTKIIKSYRDLDKYTVIFTCLAEKEKDGVETFDSFNIPGNSVKNMLKSYFDLSLHMQAYRGEGNEEKRVFLTNASLSRLAKDRSGVLEEVEDADLSAIINKVLL